MEEKPAEQQQISPDDQIEAQIIIELINDMVQTWVAPKTKTHTPRQVATAILFMGGKVTELHLADRDQGEAFIRETIQLGRDEAIRCLKLFAQEQVDGNTHPEV